MLKVAVLVSGGGTNLQAILDAIDSGRITNAEVSLVISNNPNAYALERAKNHGIEAVCISLIPSFCGVGYYGLHVHEAALKRGVKVTGATVHFVDTGTDTGPIILQKAVKIEPDDTPQSLQRSVMEKAEWKILPKAINLIANGKISVEDHIVTISD